MVVQIRGISVHVSAEHGSKALGTAHQRDVALRGNSLSGEDPRQGDRGKDEGCPPPPESAVEQRRGGGQENDDRHRPQLDGVLRSCGLLGGSNLEEDGDSQDGEEDSRGGAGPTAASGSGPLNRLSTRRSRHAAVSGQTTSNHPG